MTKLDKPSWQRSPADLMGGLTPDERLAVERMKAREAEKVQEHTPQHIHENERTRQ